MIEAGGSKLTVMQDEILTGIEKPGVTGSDDSLVHTGMASMDLQSKSPVTHRADEHMKCSKSLAVLDLPAVLLQEMSSYLEFQCFRTTLALTCKKLLARTQNPFQGFKPCEDRPFAWHILSLGIPRLRREW